MTGTTQGYEDSGLVILKRKKSKEANYRYSRQEALLPQTMRYVGRNLLVNCCTTVGTSCTTTDRSDEVTALWSIGV